MAAPGAPSIVLQRIILIVFSAVIAGLVWWQTAGISSNAIGPVRKFLKTSVPDAASKLDFTTAENSWSGLKFDAEGYLQIDGLTESALVDAVALLQNQSSEQPMARMALLLEKQFGPTATQQIMELLPVLKNYKEAEQRWWEESGRNNLSANNPPNYAELFRLQDELLGEAQATLMFSEQRRLTNMMLATQQIRNDSSLTPAEKDRALMDLQSRFQINVQETAQ